MKIFAHFSVYGLSNTYLVGPEGGGDAILIDPGKMDLELLNLIESNGYHIRSILVTHRHESHIRGVKTLRKIYEAEIYSGATRIFQFTTRRLQDRESLDIADFPVEVMAIRGHSPDSLIYKIQDALFTGDILGAGRIGSTPDARTAEVMKREIRRRILSLKPDTLIYPGHGPITTVKTEKQLNPALNEHG